MSMTGKMTGGGVYILLLIHAVEGVMRKHWCIYHYYRLFFKRLDA